MPFRSEAQRRYLFEHNPEMAKRWESETPPGTLPEHVKPKTKRKPWKRTKSAKRRR